MNGNLFLWHFSHLQQSITLQRQRDCPFKLEKQNRKRSFVIWLCSFAHKKSTPKRQSQKSVELEIGFISDALHYTNIDTDLEKRRVLVVFSFLMKSFIR